MAFSLLLLDIVMQAMHVHTPYVRSMEYDTEHVVGMDVCKPAAHGGWWLAVGGCQDCQGCQWSTTTSATLYSAIVVGPTHKVCRVGFPFFFSISPP